MSLWRQLTRGLSALTRRSAADQDVADEVSHYLEEAEAEHHARGLSDTAARRAARQELGGVVHVREEVSAYGWENLVESLLADLRYAARRLRSEPGFTAVVGLTLAVGIGATTAIFSAVNPILFQSLPYPNANRIVMVWDYGVDGAPLETTFGTYRELVDRAHSFDAIAVLKPWQPTMTGPAEPVRFEGQRVSIDYFRALGVPPVLGREFLESEDRSGGANVVILSDALWRARFGGDGASLGRQITLNGDPYTVVGVMPPGFDNVLSPTAEIWAPLQYDMSEGRAWGHHLKMVARLRSGVSPEAAEVELGSIARAPVQQFVRVSWADLADGLSVVPLQADITRGVRPALLAILGGVALVLIIACVNVTNLLLARGVQRRPEFALRAALGAGDGRLVRQLLTESFLLAAVGGGLGVAAAALGVKALVALSPPGLPRVSAIGVNGAVLAFGLAVTTLIGLAFGLTPALQAARSDPQADLQQGSPRTVGHHRRVRGALVVVEVGLALMLLISSGLLLRSLKLLFAVEPGFDPRNLLTMQVQASGHRFDDDTMTHRFFAEALEAVRRVPGVQAAAFTTQLPLTGESDKYGAHFELARSNPAEDGGALRYAVSPGYFETMGIPLRSGRLLDGRDAPGSPVAVVLNRSFADRVFAGANPIGQRLHLGRTDIPWYTVVGVVGDIKQASLAGGQSDAVYVTTDQWYAADRVQTLVVRSRGVAAALAPAVRAAIWSVDKDQPIVRVATMDDVVASSAAQRRFALILFEAFATVSLVLAAAGIYGVLSGSVAERTREIGVRSALGASRHDILALVLRQGMTLTGLGVAIGIAGAWLATQALVTLLFGVSRLDPLTYAGVIALLGGVAILACGVPAWRAARVDPARTLRVE